VTGPLLAIRNSRVPTHAFAQFPNGTAHYQNDPNELHAEVKFIRDLPTQLAAYPVGTVVPVTLKVNRTTCAGCAQALALAANAMHGRRRIDLTVLATNIYGGRQLESVPIAGGGTAVRLAPAAKTKLEHLATLKAAGVRLGVWDIWREIKAEMLLGDPRLQAVDSEIVERNLRASEQLRN
jgi:hypothetical protein